LVVGGTFINGEPISNANGATGTISSVPESQVLDVVWKHESGTDKIVGQNVTAIQSYFETGNFSFKTGGPGQNMDPSIVQTRLVRVEPDFIQSGDMSMYVEGGNYANSANIESSPYSFSPTTEHIDTHEQRGIMSLKFESNTVGGYFEMGQILVTVKPGDKRG
jgi:hypothetical protein